MDFFLGISIVILSLGVYNMLSSNNGISKSKLKEMMEMAYLDGQIDYAEGDITILKNNNEYVWDSKHIHYIELTFKDNNTNYLKYLEARRVKNNN